MIEMIEQMINFIRRVKKHTCCLCQPECCISCEAKDLVEKYENLYKIDVTT